MITKDMTLADVVKAHPNTIGFLNGLHLDYCCGGHDPIAMRGGTDGSFISTKGILTPNYFTGGLNFHSRYEFLPLPSLEKSYEVTMKLIDLIYKG